ncbi:ribokinase [Mesorhizobium sp.]|uniref:ribokinase n=1 Tax=Mesorhizobium sp. TaxID=1871066 RepID=UPI00122404B7|nr:ribokinase [Mesorhizobium sp.]TIU42728.1 MAG: ribokinase [Mesorhizobium sp.]TIV62386.1 MAG: ribokinase [Mesorhizobium sp.]
MIITFGSINVDLIFSMSKIPQVGQTLLAKSFRTEPGGKGANQAVAAARDGAEVVMVGAVGSDSMAAIALQYLQDTVDVSRLARVSLPTGCASIFIDGEGHNMIAVASGANLVASSDAVDDLLLKEGAIVLMQMENEVSQIENLIRRSKGVGARAILNLAPALPLDPEILSLCELIVVNEDEASALAGWLGCGASAQQLSNKLKTGVVRTLGSKGAEAFVHGHEVNVAALPVNAVDTTAAGDCFVGVLASALDRGLPFEAAMQRASTAAAIACSKPGSQSSIPLAVETDKFVARPPLD